MKKIMALLLATIMAVSLVACTKPSNEQSKEAAETTQETKKEEAADTTAEDNGKEDVTETEKADGPDLSEPVELTMVIQTDGNECRDNQMVDDAINEILKEKLNVKLNIKRCAFTDTRTNMNLWLSSGEPCDIFVSWFSWATYKDYYADLTPYMDLMPNALKAIGDFIGNGYDGDQLKGLPAIKDWVSYSTYLMRKDIVEETGIKPETVKTYADFEVLLRKIKELHPDMHPLTNGTATLPTLFINTINARPDGSQYETDIFTGAGTGVGLMDPADSSEVTCEFFSDFYEDTVNMAHRWAEEGLIYDSSILNGAEQVLAGTAAGYGTYYKPGIESQEKVACGTDMVCVCMPDIKDGVNVTQTSFNWGVNKNCEHIDRAVMLLDLLYSDVEINNLLSWGIEGVHYVHTEDPNIIDYPEGVTAADVGYYSWGKFEYPNNFLQYVMAPSPSNLWEEMQEFNTSGRLSKAFGFVFDRTPVEGEMTAVSNVVSQYYQGLGSGTLDPSKLEDFRKDLKDNGIDVIIAEAQRQLDEFIASQK